MVANGCLLLGQNTTEDGEPECQNLNCHVTATHPFTFYSIADHTSHLSFLYASAFLVCKLYARKVRKFMIKIALQQNSVN